MSSSDRSKQLLMGTLSQNPINVLAVRSICCEYPGLIASAGLRLKVWSVLLLGADTIEECKKIDVIDSVEKCEEQQVLEADVHRTRAEIDLMRTDEMRQTIRVILKKFCLDHEIQYKQGMNEVRMRYNCFWMTTFFYNVYR